MKESLPRKVPPFKENFDEEERKIIRSTIKSVQDWLEEDLAANVNDLSRNQVSVYLRVSRLVAVMGEWPGAMADYERKIAQRFYENGYSLEQIAFIFNQDIEFISGILG